MARVYSCGSIGDRPKRGARLDLSDGEVADALGIDRTDAPAAQSRLLTIVAISKWNRVDDNSSLWSVDTSGKIMTYDINLL